MYKLKKCNLQDSLERTAIVTTIKNIKLCMTTDLSWFQFTKYFGFKKWM